MKYTIGSALKRERCEELMPTIVFIIFSVIVLVGALFVIKYAFYAQGRKDCLEAQRYEIEYNRVISPEINEFCSTRYNINFRP